MGSLGVIDGGDGKLLPAPVGPEPVAYVNGLRQALPPGCAEKSLLQFLRELGLTGTKMGCGEGGCGACTVMVSRFQEGKICHRAVNACLAPIYSIEGCHVVTVEGIGNPRDGLHPVQERLAKMHGSQCGFCTPGFVMSMYSLLRSRAQEGQDITEDDIEASLGGNLCRCTGYRPILDAFRVFAKSDTNAYTEESIAAAGQAKANGALSNGHENGGPAKANGDTKICPSTGQPCDCGPKTSEGPSDVRKVPKHKRTAKLGAAKGEPIFPGELRRQQPEDLVIPGPIATWMRPTTLMGLLNMKSAHPEAKLVVGNSEVGIEMKFKAANYPVLIGATLVSELNEITVAGSGVTLGASVTLCRLMSTCKELIRTRPEHETSSCKAIVEQLHWFAGTQIRNTASIGGNIVTGSPISDLNPIWMAAGASFTVVGKTTGQRLIPASNFFLDYRKVDLQPHEILKSIHLPFTREFEYIKEFKQAHRREDDIAIVTAGIRLRMQPSVGGWKIAEAHLAFGGVAAKTVMAPGTSLAMVDRPLDNETLQAGLQAILKDIQMAPNAPGGMMEFRRSLAASFLFKMFVHTSLKLEAQVSGSGQPAFSNPFPAEFTSASTMFERPPASGVQVYSSNAPGEIVGEPRRHLAADLQVCGEAKYQDDIPLPHNTLHGALLMSKRPHAKLKKVDASEALSMEGVHGFFSAEDVPQNQWGPVVQDELVFADGVVNHVGQPIGVVVASTVDIARRALREIIVEYEDLPAVMSNEEAFTAAHFYEDYGTSVKCGDTELAFSSGECDLVIEGEVKMGGQEHFYLEPNACLVQPIEEDEFLVISSNQNPNKHQQVVAKILDVPASKVVSKTKRLGGGFGGKETRAIVPNVAAAVAAYHTGRPVSLVMDRDEDMQATGQRHAYMCKYKVGVSREGKLVALQVDMYSNAGNSLDLSMYIMECSMVRIDNAYKIPHATLAGHLCRTNQASNTAFRGFGGPQAIMTMECIMERIAVEVDRPAHLVRELNFYKEGELTHYGQAMESNHIRTVWDKCLQQAGGLDARQAVVDAFNLKNRFRKRGLAVTPTVFGIGFTEVFLNQAGALVHMYTDGTCLVTHGGVEMGQGLHTKMAQIAAQTLSLPLSSVYIAETSTDKVPNASPTAGSMSSDLYGMAVLDACTQLAERLKPIRDKMPDASPADIAVSAWLERIDLSAHGWHKVSEVNGYGNNNPYKYYSYGASVSEVELDTLTGDFHVIKTDIVMDVGNPLNPAIDIGQIEGGFVQGMGWLCIEELVWGDKQHPWVQPGHLFTKGPGTYKIPSVNDIPINFNVTLLHDAPNPRAVHSSKAIGEPPFHLATSVFFALKNAVYAARKDAGKEGWFQLHAPCTPERLRMACQDFITEAVAPNGLTPNISC